MATWELIVHGRVQGVGFRWHVYNCAMQHNIRGYTRNQSDGTVMILAQAEDNEFERFVAAIRAVSGRATIEGIDALRIDYAKNYNEFEIR